MPLGRAALRRRRSIGLVDQLQDLQEQVNEQSSLNRFGEYVIQGTEDDDGIQVGHDGTSAYIESTNFDHHSEGFRIRTDGRVDIYNDLLLGGDGDKPIQLQLIGEQKGEWATRSIWENPLSYYEFGTKGYGTAKSNKLEKYGQLALQFDGAELLTAKTSTATAPTITYPLVSTVVTNNFGGNNGGIINIQFEATEAGRRGHGFRGFGSLESPTTVENKNFGAANGEQKRIEGLLVRPDDGSLVMDLRPFNRGSPELLTDIFSKPHETILYVKGKEDHVSIVERISDAVYETPENNGRYQNQFAWSQINPNNEFVLGNDYHIQLFVQTIDERRIEGGDVYFDEVYTGFFIDRPSTGTTTPIIQNNPQWTYLVNSPINTETPNNGIPLTIPGLTNPKLSAIASTYTSTEGSLRLVTNIDLSTVNGLRVNVQGLDDAVYWDTLLATYNKVQLTTGSYLGFQYTSSHYHLVEGNRYRIRIYKEGVTSGPDFNNISLTQEDKPYVSIPALEGVPQFYYNNQKIGPDKKLYFGTNIPIAGTDEDIWIDFGDASGPSGQAGSLVGAFLDLSDTPNSYANQAKKFLRVNSTNNGIIFDPEVLATLSYANSTAGTPGTRNIPGTNPQRTITRGAAPVLMTAINLSPDHTGLFSISNNRLIYSSTATHKILVFVTTSFLFTTLTGSGEMNVAWTIWRGSTEYIEHQSAYTYDTDNFRSHATNVILMEPGDQLELRIHNNGGLTRNYVCEAFNTFTTVDLTGFKGDIGATGLTGPKGDKGDRGLQGIQGIQGIQGRQGHVGTPGLPGPTGERGETGATGPRGQQGIQGIQGQTGPRGNVGPQGLQGPQGLTGPAGSDGTGVPSGTAVDLGKVLFFHTSNPFWQFVNFTHLKGNIALTQIPDRLITGNKIGEDEIYAGNMRDNAVSADTLDTSTETKKAAFRTALGITAANAANIYQSTYNLNYTSTTLTSQTPQRVPMFAGTVDSSHGLSISSSTISVTKAGLYIIVYEFLSTQPGDLQLSMNKGVSHINGSVVRHYPPGGESRSGMETTFAVELVNGDTLSLWITPKDVPAFANLVPQAPATLVINTSPTTPNNREAVWTTVSGQRPTNAWQISWKRTDQNDWSHWEQINHGDWRNYLLTLPNNVTIDMRVRGVNQYGAGPWRQRRQGGSTSLQTATSQQVAGNGTLTITTLEV